MKIEHSWCENFQTHLSQESQLQSIWTLEKCSSQQMTLFRMMEGSFPFSGDEKKHEKKNEIKLKIHFNIFLLLNNKSLIISHWKLQIIFLSHTISSLIYEIHESSFVHSRTGSISFKLYKSTSTTTKVHMCFSS